jgi:hypothetical protein
MPLLLKIDHKNECQREKQHALLELFISASLEFHGYPITSPWLIYTIRDDWNHSQGPSGSCLPACSDSVRAEPLAVANRTDVAPSARLHHRDSRLLRVTWQLFT